MSAVHDQSKGTTWLRVVLLSGIYSCLVRLFFDSVIVDRTLLWVVTLVPAIAFVVVELTGWGKRVTRWARQKRSKRKRGKPEKAKDHLGARTQALAVMQGYWHKWYQPPGKKREHEIARIDSSGNYYTHSPRHGYSLDGEPKYVMRIVDYDTTKGIITLQNIKPDGRETKHETLRVVNNDLLVGHNTYDRNHTLEYRRITHDPNAKWPPAVARHVDGLRQGDKCPHCREGVMRFEEWSPGPRGVTVAYYRCGECGTVVTSDPFDGGPI